MPGRGAAPAPLSLSSEASTRRQDSFGSDYSDLKVGQSLCTVIGSQSNLPSQDMPQSAGHGWFDDGRKGSSDHSSPSRKSTRSSSAPSHSKPNSPNVNVYTHCGRHSDQYLFGGWSNIMKSTFHSKKG
ncbi:hypothetical protein F4779DRAFT_160277 [Xylariaceae sp. FL0662B]|nr:hypothetical protein F4779DRAFT_160277 [Xylariaceae sp. FL0662B]